MSEKRWSLKMNYIHVMNDKSMIATTKSRQYWE